MKCHPVIKFIKDKNRMVIRIQDKIKERCRKHFMELLQGEEVIDGEQG